MTQHYLCLSVTFLDSCYHGKEINGLQDWPPSPLRLFAAIISGCNMGIYAHDWPDAKEALRWLETLPPPHIVAPAALPVMSYQSFVPNNDADVSLDPQHRLTSKVFQPYYMIDNHTVHYLFPFDLSQYDMALRIAKAVRKVVALGRAIDVVTANGQIITEDEAAALIGERWLPSPGGRYLLRTPAEGTLQEAIDVYARQMEFASALDSITRSIWFGKMWIAGRTVRYSRIVTPPRRPFAAFAIQPLFGHPYVQHNDIARLAAMMRHVLIQIGTAASRNHTAYIPGGVKRFIAGHLKKDDYSFRLSYLPLPTIDDDHRRGQIRSVVVAGPYTCRDEYVRWIWEKLPGAILVEARKRQPIARLVPIDSADANISQYLHPAKVWVSVTPVLLPGYDDKKEDKAKKLIYRAIQRDGIALDLVDSLEISKSPFAPYLPNRTVYFRPLHLKDYPAWHVRITFNQAIAGPLSIGIGRHIGIGLLAHDPHTCAS